MNKICIVFISVINIIPYNISQVYASGLSNYEIDKSPLDISAESNGIKITLKEADWNFPTIELKSLGRNIYNINKTFEKEKVKLDINNLEISSIQFSIVYTKDIENTQYSSSQWNIDISFSIKDDLGVFISHCEFKNINKNANKINIYPEICFWRSLGDNILNDKGESIQNIEKVYNI